MLMIRYKSNAMRKKRNSLYNRYTRSYDKINTIPHLYKNIAPAGMPPKVYHPAGSVFLSAQNIDIAFKLWLK